ncbi:MAG: hypothetical protein E7432_07660 [Ruminococcaceae bacterium]|nr:hypothetical protein [Oscillospiraceae bacterium]
MTLYDLWEGFFLPDAFRAPYKAVVFCLFVFIIWKIIRDIRAGNGSSAVSFVLSLIAIGVTIFIVAILWLIISIPRNSVKEEYTTTAPYYAEKSDEWYKAAGQKIPD